MRILRNLAYFAVGIFLAASFLLGNTYALANHPVREIITPSVYTMQDGRSLCSAVMIAPERALTAAHCLNMEAPYVTIGGYKYPVLEGYAASPRDVAILIIPGAPCPCARVSDTPLKVGDFIAVVGYPLGLAQVVTYGEFQARIIDKEDGQEYLMVTALGAPGNSGGGLFNEYGDLVGIVVSGIQGHSLTAVELFTIEWPVK